MDTHPGLRVENIDTAENSYCTRTVAVFVTDPTAAMRKVPAPAGAV